MRKLILNNKLKLLVAIILVSLIVIGCSSGKRVSINKARLYNNDDDVKIHGINKVVTIEGRDYFVIYAIFKNNTKETVENVQFRFELTDDAEEIIENGAFEIDKIEAGKTIQSEYYVDIDEVADINNIGTLTFTDFQHEGTKDSVKCSKEISFDFDKLRIEEME
ncbi:MAG: hypothetical protein E7262_03750 [Lachnospiraceae bacterium]|nr:hypothetical protein [Lachnospiraceae bacterium]